RAHPGPKGGSSPDHKTLSKKGVCDHTQSTALYRLRGTQSLFSNGASPVYGAGIARTECTMKITELLLAELDREAVGIRKTLERVPEGKNDWKPHEKSMPLGNLATIVATIPAWLDMVVNMDELDINPPGGPKFRLQEWK